MAKKSRISHIKKSNQQQTKLSKQGKLKKKRNKKTLPKKSVKLPEKVTYSDNEEDELPTIGRKDAEFLRRAINEKSYQFLSGVDLSCPDPLIKKKRRKPAAIEESAFEENYESRLQQEPQAKRQKMLLPIKTAKGLVARAEAFEDSDAETGNDTGRATQANKTLEEENEPMLRQLMNKDEVSAADLLVARQETLERKKFRIGLLCAGLLEAPEGKIDNFKALLTLLEETDPRVRITVRKLTLVSLVEVFKDLLPAYQIRHNVEATVKLKKEVKQLHDYENALVKAYQTFLQKVEKMTSILRRKKGDTRIYDQAELRLAELGLSSLCELVEAHPYFNFSKNIIQFIVPYLNVSKDSARSIVVQCVRSIFRTDSRGEVSLEIVRCINKWVKTKNCAVHPAMLEVFLSLKLKNVNLDKEKEDEMKKKKLMSKKQNVLRLSKRERKREKRLKELNQELLETKAEENKQSKMHHLTEITSLVFAMYFKVLKSAPSSRLLTTSLEGIAKFAHCINVDFYQDLISVLDQLILNENLGQKEQLCCIQTVFTILNYEGATINIDPVRFYNHFYANLLSLTAGKNHIDLPMVLTAADTVVIRRRKQLSLQRLLAFVKRLATLSVQLLPNGTLALLSVIKQAVLVGKACGILLDTDATFGQGVYQPELDQPEYCNASATAFWELLPLQRHYHPTVREYAKYIASLADASRDTTASGKTFSKKTAFELYKEYDFSDVKFVPAVTPPSAVSKKKARHGPYRISSPSLKNYMKQIMTSA